MVSGSLYFTLPSHRHSEPVRLFPPEPDDRARNLGNRSHVLSCAFSFQPHRRNQIALQLHGPRGSLVCCWCSCVSLEFSGSWFESISILKFKSLSETETPVFSQLLLLYPVLTEWARSQPLVPPNLQTCSSVGACSFNTRSTCTLKLADGRAPSEHQQLCD